MTPDERCDVSNGIWMCGTCSTIIDNNNGADFSVEMLRQMKSQRQAEASAELGRAAMFQLAGEIRASGIGEIIGAHIQKPTRIESGTRVWASGFGRVTGVKIGGD